jgi:carbamoyltransferase
MQSMRGELIVCTPEDAFHSFMGAGIEALAVGNCFLLKEEQDPALTQDYETAFRTRARVLRFLGPRCTTIS